jgi:hypothetical protein
MLKTFVVTFIDISSGGVTQRALAQDVRFGTGLIVTAADRDKP